MPTPFFAMRKTIGVPASSLKEKISFVRLGFPIEAIKDQHKKNELIGGILKAME